MICQPEEFFILNMIKSEDMIGKEQDGPDFSWVRRIADTMKEQGAIELDVQVPDSDFSLYLRLSRSAWQQASVLIDHEQMEKVDPYEDETRYAKVRSPLTGAFYRKPDPKSPPYVSMGDYVEEGQPVCLIEANKMFNRIDAEVSGEVVEIIVEDKSPVSRNTVLMVIDKTKGPPAPSYTQS